MKTYNTNTLVDGSPRDDSWGLSWYRFLSGDKPVNDVYPAFSLEDEEIQGLLYLTSKVSDGSRYYFPQEALIMKILSDPGYAIQISEESYSTTFVSPEKLAEQIRSVASRHLTGFYPPELSGSLGLSSARFTPRF
jgi:hypothetical protein